MTEDTMKRKTDGSRRHGRIRFYAQAAPDPENAWASARPRFRFPPPRRPTCWTGLKATIARRPAGKALDFAKPAEWQANLTLTPEDKVAGYNNFYEFGLDKADPAANAVACAPILDADHRRSGETADPDHDDLTKRFPLEERIYRMLRGSLVDGGPLGRLPAA
jgi:hypothetical protein